MSTQTETVAAAPTGGSFGQSQVGTLVDTGGAGYLDLSGPYTVSAAATVSQLNGYMAGSSAASRLRGVIYTNSGGQPGTLVAATSEVSLAANRTAGWVTLPLTTPVQLAAGSYWLGYWYADGNSRLYYLNLAGAERYKAAAYSSTANPPTSFGTASSASSSYSLTATYVPTGSPPANTSLPAISGSAVNGQPLTASTGTWSGSPTSYAYEWRRCDTTGAGCVAIAGASGTGYTLVSADVGATLRVAVTASNAAGSTTAVSAQTPVVAQMPPPANSGLPAISGSAVVGQLLSASTGVWSGNPTGYAYEWRRCDTTGAACTAILAATGSTYTLTVADLGSTIRVAVTASNPGGNTTAVSTQTATVAQPPPPANSGLPAISGSAVVGQLLSASTGVWSGNPTGYAYEWRRCDTTGAACTAILAATGSTYTLTVADLGSTIRVAVTASNPGGNTTALSTQTATVAQPPPPVNTGLPAISGSAVVGQLLSASTGVWSGNPTGYAYEWRRCDTAGAACTAILAATGSTYTLTVADLGSTIRVAVTASNPGGNTTAVSTQTATVAAAPTGGSFGQSQVGTLVDTGGAGYLDLSGPYTVSAAATVSQLNGYMAGSSAASRLRGVIYTNSGGQPGTLVAATSEVSLAANRTAGWVTLPLTTPVQLAAGSYWLGYWYADGNSRLYYLNLAGAERYKAAAYSSTANPPTSFGTASSASSSYSLTATYVPTGSPPANTSLPAISGSAVNGQPLTASTGTWSGSPTSYAYEWRRCDTTGAGCVAIAGASGTGYTLVSADVGATLRVAVTASNAAGSTTTVSAQTPVVAQMPPPANSGLPAISGSAVVGQLLSASTGVWSGNPTGYAYEWRRCDTTGAACTAILAATGSTYTLTVADLGSTIRVAVTASNPGGNTTAVSTQTATVAQPPPPANTGLPAISGSAVVGQLLSASTGVWSGNPTSYAYEWRRCDTAGAACTAILAATGSTYTLTVADLGSTIRVAVTASNPGGNTTAVSTQTATVAQPPPPVNTGLPAISGSAVVGQLLSASTGVWSGNPTSYAYEWRRCDTAGAACTAILAATGSTYTLTVADLGSTIRVAVTASNPGGNTTALSTQTATVAAAPTGGSFGQSQVGTLVDTGGAGYLDLSGPYTVSAAATVSQLNGYMAGSSAASRLRGVIYTNSGGQPGTLVAATSEVSLAANRTAGWVTLPLTTPVQLAAGSYWLGYWYADGNSRLYYLNLAGAERYKAAAYSSTANPPTSFGTASSASSSYSLTATYNLP